MRQSQAIRCLLPVAVIWAILGCSDKPVGPADPHAPNPPSDPFPAHRAQQQPVVLTLDWSCSDPDDDPLTYSLYFGTEYPPPLVDDSVTETTYDPGPLKSDHVYYWFVVARDPEGRSSRSPFWRFSTREIVFYPLSIANSWEYTGGLITFNYRPVGYPPQTWADTIRERSVVAITAWTHLPMDVDAFVFDELVTVESRMHPYQLDSFPSQHYFEESNDGLYYYGKSGATATGGAPLGNQSDGLIMFHGRSFETAHDVIRYITKAADVGMSAKEISDFENPPLLSLQYPLKVGSQWTYRQAEQPWRIDKMVTGRESIDVPAGRFDCYRVRWLFDLDNDALWDADIEFFDYYSRKGLVRRSLTTRNLVERSYERDTVAFLDLKLVFELSSYIVD